MKKYSILFSLLLLLLASVTTSAQFGGSYGGAWNSTWNNPISASASVMIQGAINRKMLERSIANQEAGKRTGSASASSAGAAPTLVITRTAPPKYSMLRFRPTANSGVAKQTADAIGSNAQERGVLLAIFQDIKKSYEAEVAKDGKSNNIAAALTFFMTSASMAYHQAGEPPEAVTNALFEVMQQQMSASPEFKKMTDLEKQKMHDWLVVSGGFVLTGYLDAAQKGDQKQLVDYKELADALFKTVMGTSVEKFNLASVDATSGG